MIYVVDTCVFRHMLEHVYRSVFPEMWVVLEEMISEGEIISVKESYRELELHYSKDDEKMKWLKTYKDMFEKASPAECKIVKDIYAHSNFQNGIRSKNILEGRPVADAFLVAKAKLLRDGIIVTREKYSENSAKIPNICEVFKIKWIDEEAFQFLLKQRTVVQKSKVGT